MKIGNLAELEGIHKRLCGVEQGLMDYKMWLNLALKISDVATWQWDARFDKLSWDPRMHELFGTNDKIFTGKSDFFFNNIHKEDRLRVLQEFQEAMRGKDSFDYTFRFVSPVDGSVRSIRAEGEVLRNAYEGKVATVVGVCAKAGEVA